MAAIGQNHANGSLNPCHQEEPLHAEASGSYVPSPQILQAQEREHDLKYGTILMMGASSNPDVRTDNQSAAVVSFSSHLSGLQSSHHEDVHLNLSQPAPSVVGQAIDTPYVHTITTVLLARGGRAMSALRELSGLVAENADLRADNIPVLASLCPPPEALKSGSTRITSRHLNGILAVSQFLAQSDGGQHRQQLLSIVLEFLLSVPSLSRNTFWPTSFSAEAAREYFPELLSHVSRIVSVDSEAALTVSTTISEIIQRVSAGGVGGVEAVLANSRGAKALFLALGKNCPFVHLQDADKVIVCLLEHWIGDPPESQQLRADSGATSSSSAGTSGAKSPPRVRNLPKASPSSGKKADLEGVKDRNEAQAVATEKGKLKGFLGFSGSKMAFSYPRNVTSDSNPKTSSFASPESTDSTSLNLSSFSTPLDMSGELTPVRRSGSLSGPESDDAIFDQLHGPNSQVAYEETSGFEKHHVKFETESVNSLERQEIAYSILTRILEKHDLGSDPKKLHIQELRATAVHQLRTLLPILKIRRPDWPADVADFKFKLVKTFQVSQAAALLQIRCLQWLETDPKHLKAASHESLSLLMDAADACNSSPWRMSKPCEDLFGTLITGVAQVAANHQIQMQRVLLRFKALILTACAQANGWGTNLGSTSESMIKGITTSVEVGWNTDKSAVESFILALAAHTREKDSDKSNRRAQVNLQINIISFLSDLSVCLDKMEVVELVLPLFIENLEERDAPDPSLVRLKLLEAIGRMACLGSEKSYREVVVLLTRSYLDKLSMVGSAHSRTVPPEATTERLETLPGAFLQLAKGLRRADLRVDLRRRLLSLCSDVGRIAESKNTRSGADLLGPLLPALAEACTDNDPYLEIEASLLKLYRNLWFYITLFGLAPPLPRGHLSYKSGSQGGILKTGLSQARSGGMSSAINSGLSNGSMPLQATGGPYTRNPQWATAVEQISQATPPLAVGSLKWLEDELELSALHNSETVRGYSNDKEVAAQKAALSSALGARVEMSLISGVTATYLLAVAYLEVLRYRCSGGVTRHCSVEEGECTSAFSCVFKYLETPDLSPVMHQCLVAIAHQAFNAARLWLSNKRTAFGEEVEQRDAAIVAHACFLIKTSCHRDKNVRELAVTLLEKMKNEFPQVLWNPICLNAVLSLVADVSPPTLTPDAGAVSSRSFSHQKVHEWISQALSLAPCTMQGLLQEQLRRLNRWQSATSDLLSVLSGLHLNMAKANKNSSMARIPAVIAAAVAAAGLDPQVVQSGGMEVLSTGIMSANKKSNCAGEISGMKRLHSSISALTINTPTHMQTPGMSVRRRMSFNEPLEKSDHYTSQDRDLGFNEMLTARFVQQLQEYVVAAERGLETDPLTFRDVCLSSAALVLSDMGASKEIPEGTSHLLRLLCWCPAHIFTPAAMETGLFVWTWILSAAPQLDAHVLAELVDAWLWTVDTEKGLFASGIENSGPAAKLRPQLIPGKPGPGSCEDPVQGISAHRIWLGFFLDRYEAIRYGTSDQLFLLSRLLQGSICRPSQFSSHPAAAGSFFALLLLGLKFSSFQAHLSPFFGKGGEDLLEDFVYRAGLSWFVVEPVWYDFNIPGLAQAEADSISIFLQHLSADSKDGSFKEAEGSISSKEIARAKRKQLLVMLCQSELERMETWANPLVESSSRWRVAGDRWIEYAKTAWSTDPRIAIALVGRFPGVNILRAEISSLVQKNPHELYDIPEALPYIITPTAVDEDSPVLQKLPHWAPCSITSALNFLTPPYKGHHRVLAYVLRVLESYPPERVTFFMPQLVQSLRYDKAGLVEGYLMVAAQRSTLFAHILIWQLQGEEPPSSEDKVPEKEAHAVAKSNLYDIVPRVKKRVIDSFTHEAYDIFVQEFAFFDKVTSISGALYPLPKEERRAGIRRELEKIHVDGDQIYLPTDPSKLVRGIKLDSGIPLQSAAKVPIMITFEVVEKDGDPLDVMGQACIFKVGDDCRQDVLALQVISLLRDIFEAVGLSLYLFPYGVLPTGYGRGIIEVVRNSSSRNQLGPSTDGGLYEIFARDYGPVGSERFERARDNFIVSSAGYAVASLILQPKDRHNGNLLLDSEGRLVHIDFGFILETSPGGNMRFESAHFKISHEMTQLLDPDGSMKSEQWFRFVSLCVKGYLAARDHMEGIISTVLLMSDSGLPCFSRGDPIGNLRKRLHPEMTEREAANFMIKTCNDSYNKWTTSGYDLIQRIQQGIEY